MHSIAGCYFSQPDIFETFQRWFYIHKRQAGYGLNIAWIWNLNLNLRNFFFQLMNVTIRFDEEKRQSRRLNEQVLSTSGSCRHEKQNTRELKLQLSVAREENERLKATLEELTKFSEVLNVKFKMVSDEKNKLKEQSEEMSFSVQSCNDRNTELGCKLTSKASCFLNACSCYLLITS